MGTLPDIFYEDLSCLLSIRSVNGDCGPTGPDAPLGRGVAQAIEAFLAIGRRMGFHTVNLDGYAGYVQWGDTGPVVAILTHLDTVPAGGEWAAPPFALTRREGKLYGRGVCDDKGPALVSLYAMQALRDCAIVAHVHDEVILEADPSMSLEAVCERMGRTPPWAQGLLLRADGYATPFYKKD